MIKSLMIGCGVALATIAAVPAQAAVFAFTINSTQDSAVGQFTVGGGTSPFTVTGVTGVVDGAAITGLSTYGGADQSLSDTSPFVTRAGIGFAANGVEYNIFKNYTDSSGNPVYSFCSSTFNGSCTGGSADAAPVASLTVSPLAAVPEPAAWTLMIGGFGIAGGALRRRATKISYA